MSTVLPIRTGHEAADALPLPWRWTREAYHRAVELGLFGEDDRIELIEGEIYPVSPQSRRHFKAICRAARILERAFGPQFSVEQQGPAALSPRSEPEPDVTVVRGDTEDYDDHPGAESIALALEVSDSSLAKDRVIKAAAYAQAGIRDYWLLNLKDRTLEVRRDPGPDPADPMRAAYSSLHVYAETEEVAPLEAPDAAVRVGDLLRARR